MTSMNLKLKCNSNFYLFLSIAFVYLFLTWVTNKFIITDNIYISLWSEKLSTDRAIQLLEKTKKIEWVAYLLIPVFLYFKLLLIAFTFKSGFYVSNTEVPFDQIFKIVLMAELIPIVALFVQFAYFLLNGVESMEQLNSFAPFSLFSLLNSDELPVYFSYPLRLISLYEVAYWILLAIGIRANLQKSFVKSLGFVASSYGLGLLLWVAFVVFIQVQFS